MVANCATVSLVSFRKTEWRRHEVNYRGIEGGSREITRRSETKVIQAARG